MVKYLVSDNKVKRALQCLDIEYFKQAGLIEADLIETYFIHVLNHDNNGLIMIATSKLGTAHTLKIEIM